MTVSLVAEMFNSPKFSLIPLPCHFCVVYSLMRLSEIVIDSQGILLSSRQPSLTMKPRYRKPTVWTEDDFEVKRSTIPRAGQGLFSKVSIEAGDTIGPYTGKILTDKQANSEPYVNSLYLVWVCKDCWIWGEGEFASYTRFINHDDNRPNAELVTTSRWRKARIAALRRIRPGEEIFFDYGESYWDCVDINKEEVPR